jgi:putative transposase
VETCHKCSVSTGTFYSWKNKFEHKGEVGLKVTYDIKSQYLKATEEENRVLRKLLSDRETELDEQRELLKKSLERPI